MNLKQRSYTYITKHYKNETMQRKDRAGKLIVEFVIYSSVLIGNCDYYQPCYTIVNHQLWLILYVIPFC